MATRVGDLVRVKNNEGKLGAAENYHHVRVRLPKGTERDLLLTDNEVARAVARAAKNPEDLPAGAGAGWLRRLFG